MEQTSIRTSDDSFEKPIKNNSDSGRKRKIWIVSGITIGLLFAGGLIGGLIYYYMRQSNRSSPSQPATDGPSTTSTRNTTIEPDPRYTRSFWGLDYTPLGSQMDLGCSIT